jgi:hypothetical protein
MSKQIHDEQQRRKQVKFRAPESLIEEFDEAIGTNRSAALRQLMKNRIGRAGELDTPDDEDLAKAYRWLVEYVNSRGKTTVRLRHARNQLAQHMSSEANLLRSEIFRPLEERGYISIDDGPPGYTADGCIRVREHRKD